MKKTLLLLTVVFAFAACGNNGDWRDLDGLALKGRVKNVITKEFLVKEKFGEIQKYGDVYSTEIMQFNKSGMRTESAYLGSDGEVLSKYKTLYNDNGFISEFISYKDAGNSINKRHIYKLNDEGDIVEANVFDGSGKLKIKKNIKWGKNKSGDVTFEEMSYDANSNALVGIVIKSILTKDKKKMKERRTYREDGAEEGVWIFDKKGREINYTWFLSDGKPHSSEFIYDKNSFVSSEIRGESILTYEYELDKTGNWIRQVEYDDGEPSRIRERDIEYY